MIGTLIFTNMPIYPTEQVRESRGSTPSRHRNPGNDDGGFCPSGVKIMQQPGGHVHGTSESHHPPTACLPPIVRYIVERRRGGQVRFEGIWFLALSRVGVTRAMDDTRLSLTNYEWCLIHTPCFARYPLLQEGISRCVTVFARQNTREAFIC